MNSWRPPGARVTRVGYSAARFGDLILGQEYQMRMCFRFARALPQGRTQESPEHTVYAILRHGGIDRKCRRGQDRVQRADGRR
jgi:hypothetical protein